MRAFVSNMINLVCWVCAKERVTGTLMNADFMWQWSLDWNIWITKTSFLEESLMACKSLLSLHLSGILHLIQCLIPCNLTHSRKVHQMIYKKVYTTQVPCLLQLIKSQISILLPQTWELQRQGITLVIGTIKRWFLDNMKMKFMMTSQKLMVHLAKFLELVILILVETCWKPIW